MSDLTPRRPLSLSSPRPRPRLLVPLSALLVVAATLALLPPLPPPVAPVEDIQPPHVWLAGRLRVGVDASYPPFAEIVDSQYRGHDVELARRLAEHLGLTIEFVNIPFDGLYDALRVSRVDVIISALPRMEELDGTVIYSRPYFQAGEMLVVAQDSSMRGVADLPGRIVGVELGSSGDGVARRLLAGGAGFTLRADFTSPQAALEALQAGSVDTVVVDRVTALSLLARFPTLTMLDQPLSDVPYVIGMPFDDPTFARRVDDWLRRRERDGTLARLTDAYLR